MRRTLLIFGLMFLTAAWPLGACGVVFHEHDEFGAHAHTSLSVELHWHQHQHLEDHAGVERQTELPTTTPSLTAPVGEDVDWTVHLDLCEGVMATSSTSSSQSNFALNLKLLGPLWSAILPPMDGPERVPREASNLRPLGVGCDYVSGLLMTSHAILL